MFAREAIAAVFPGLYVGEVLDVSDPDRRGRVQVSVPAVFGDDAPQSAAWARPCFPYGHFFVPEVGDHVWIAFENGDPDAPIWLGIWYPQGETAPEADVSPPARRVIKTPSGNLVLLDDQDEKLVITDSNGNTVTLEGQGITLEDSRNNTVKLDNTGITLTDKSGNELELSSFKTWLTGFTDVFKTAWTPAPNDGGAALKTAMGTFLGANPIPM